MRSFFTFQIRNTILFTEAELQAKVDVPHTIAMLCCPDVLLCLFLHLFHTFAPFVVILLKAPGAKLQGEGDADDPGARSHVQYTETGTCGVFQHKFDKFLGFGPWNQSTRIRQELPSVEFRRPEQMLERDALGFFL